MAANPHPSQKTSASALIEEGRDVIVIERLEVAAEVGILDSERGRTQTVRFDIEMQTVPGYRRIVRETGTFVSYADAVEFIQQKAASGGHIDLVEEWAETVAEFALRNDLVDQVTVKVTKPDIFEEAAGVGIRITRRRAPL